MQFLQVGFRLMLSFCVAGHWRSFLGGMQSNFNLSEPVFSAWSAIFVLDASLSISTSVSYFRRRSDLSTSPAVKKVGVTFLACQKIRE